MARLSSGAALFVAGALPGETVRARCTSRRGEGWAAVCETVIEASAARRAPPCALFGECGGCTLQHWDDAAYREWKRGLLHAALQAAGFADPTVGPLAVTPPGARRRMDLALRRTPQGVVIGLHAARSDAVVDLRECPVLHPSLFALLKPLRQVLAGAGLLRRSGSLIVNWLDSGADILLRGDAAASLADRQILIGFARAQDVARLSWAQGAAAPELLCELRPVRHALSGVAVSLPPGGFLQASREGEAAIVAAVLAGIGTVATKARIVELYAGCGTLTFALQRLARVHAFEGDAAAVTALAAARAGTPGGRIEIVRRDLARQPLQAAELRGAAAVVLDPPHAGAAAQIAPIIGSDVARVIYVSCNPATLARDLRGLANAGFTLLAATPVDQFLWSAQLESVVVLGR